MKQLFQRIEERLRKALNSTYLAIKTYAGSVSIQILNTELYFV
jgi:hypothetical protein